MAAIPRSHGAFLAFTECFASAFCRSTSESFASCIAQMRRCAICVCAVVCAWGYVYSGTNVGICYAFGQGQMPHSYTQTHTYQRWYTHACVRTHTPPLRPVHGRSNWPPLHRLKPWQCSCSVGRSLAHCFCPLRNPRRRARAPACVRVCLCVCVWACVGVCGRAHARARAYWYAYIFVCVHAHVFTRVLVCLYIYA